MRRIGLLAAAATVLLFTFQPWQTASASGLRVTGSGMVANLGVQEALYPRYAGSLDTISYGSGDQVLLWHRASGEASAFPLDFEYMRDMAWSLDGTKAAFAGYKSAKEGPVSPGIWIVGKDGNGFVEIAKPADADTAYESPAWSPDGTKLAFTATHAALADETGVVYDRRVMVMNADGTGLIEVAKGSQPSWSRDSKQLAFTVGVADGISHEVWTADADGSKARKVAEGTSPSWSPAGPFLVYTKMRTEHRVLRKDAKGQMTFAADVTYQELWAMNLEDGKQTRLTQSAFPQELVDRLLAESDRRGDQSAVYAVSGMTSDEDAAWSPDGSRILFTRNTTEEQGPHYTLQELYVDYK